MNWRRESIALAAKNNATHVVIGVECGYHYGVIAYAADQFTAYRIRRAVIECGGFNVIVLPNNQKTLNKVEQEIETFFFKVR